MSKIIPKVGTSMRVSEMSTAVDIAQTLERRERQRAGTLVEARRRVADKLKIGVGSFENIVRGRVKRIDAHVRDAMQALLVREYEQDIARLSHELEIHRRTGTRLDASEVVEVEACLQKAKELMGGKT